MRGDCALPAGSLMDSGVNISPPELWIRLVRHIRPGISQTTTKLSQKEFVDNLEVHMAYVGETVILSTTNEENRPATLVGLDACGGIRVRTSAGEQVFYSGSFYSASGK
jgi:biotin-(acetyl-CoA carboxylase) ligase